MQRHLFKCLLISARRGQSSVAVARALPQEGSICLHFNRKLREAPHRVLWRRKNGSDHSSWNQCKKSFEALATNFSNLEIGDRVLLVGDCDVHMFNITLAIQKRGAHLCSIPTEGLTTKLMEQYIELLRPKMIFLGKDKVSVHDPLSKETPQKMDLDLYGMMWKIFPISNVIEGLPLKSKRYAFVEQIVLCDQVEALNHHDMITNIKYFETARDQDYYESPLVHLAMHTSPLSPALSLCSAGGKWVTHTHTSLIRGGYLFANAFFGPNERVVLLPGAQTAACGFLVMYAVLQSGATMCFAEDQMISTGDCKRITRSVFLHQATTMVGTKAQWTYLLKHGDAVAKKDDTQKQWFGTLQSAIVFLDDLEAVGDIVSQIKNDFGISCVHTVRGCAETLNFSSYDEGKLPEHTSLSIKDKHDATAGDESQENFVWINAPHASSLYWNNIGLMQTPQDNSGAIKLAYKGKKTADGNVSFTRSVSLKELVI